ncbi:hypothetical protein G6F57_020026 [Rhizopus arrhizus]|nr:hypothetical protein G6F57_020026 [Rhizopus arrhizus]
MSWPNSGNAGSPGSDMASNGHGLGLRWQKCRKSAASARGRMARLACTCPGARFAVGPVSLPLRASRRACRANATLSLPALPSAMPIPWLWCLIGGIAPEVHAVV